MPSRPTDAVPCRSMVLAFLADCKENPEDDTPRLILSDWLQDQGDPRGEFVRLQCGTPTPEQNQQAASLLHQHRSAWLGMLTDRGIVARCLRGLVQVLATPRQMLSKRLAGLPDYEPLAWVESLRLWDFRAEDLPKLAASPHWQTLASLDLSTNSYHTDHLVDPSRVGVSRGDWTALPDVPGLPRLSELDLSCQDIGQVGAVALSRCPPMPRLRQLCLQANNLGNRGMQQLAQGRAFTQLHTLNLNQNRLFADGFAELAGWPVLSGLSVLHVPRNYPGDEGVAHLARSAYLTNLKVLSLSADTTRGARGAWEPVRFGSGAAVALAQSAGLPSLRRLVLENNSIGPEGATALADSPHLSGLQELLLGGNGIGDAGAIALANSPHCANLTELSLRFNGLTDQGARALVDSPHLTRLAKLNLRANRDITEPVRQALRARFDRMVEM